MAGNDCPDHELLVAYLNGEVDEETAERLDEHFRICQECELAMQVLEQSVRLSTEDNRELSSHETLGECQQTEVWDAAGHGSERAPSEAGKPASLPNVGPYRIVGKLGEGGMGSVFLAHDPRLDRQVALKMPRYSRIEDPEILNRLMQEARAAAGLRHAHICPIYEVGDAEGQPYIAMAYIRGTTLHEWIKQKPPVRDVAEMMATLSEAVDFAHERGIVHRDLKPRNVMMDAETNTPILMDFGLAVDVGHDAIRRTQDGQVLGTPAYMSPEQAAGRILEVNRASDIYSLGAILYELLSGDLPFKGTLAETLAKVQQEEPASLRTIAPNVHRDLETIVLKCMAKEPGIRYSSAAELAADLRRFSRGEPIVATRIGPLRRIFHKVRRRPWQVGTTLAVAVALSLVVYFVPRMDEAQQTNMLVREIHERLDQSQWNAADTADVDARIDQLEKLSPVQAQEVRARLQRRMVQAIQQELQPPRLEASDVLNVDALLEQMAQRSPEVARDLRKRRDERLREWQLDFALKAPFVNAFDILPERWVTISADSQSLALRPEGMPDTGPISLLTSRQSQGNTRFDAVFEGTWQPGQRLGLLLHSDGGDPGPITCIACSHDGRQFAAGNAAGIVSVWNLEPARQLHTMLAHTQGVRAIAFDPSGQWVATVGGDGAVVLWNAVDWSRAGSFSIAPTGKAPQPRSEPTTSLAFSHDSRYLAVGQPYVEYPCEVVVWEIANQREATRLKGHTDSIAALDFHPQDAAVLASSGLDNTVRVWNLSGKPEPAVFEGVDDTGGSRIWDAMISVQFNHDGTSIVAGKRSEHLYEWDLESKELLHAWNTAAVGNGRDGLNTVLTTNDHSLLVARHRDQLDIWAFPSMKYSWTVSSGPFCLTPQGDRLCVGTNTGTVMVWDLSRERLAAKLGGRSLSFVIESLNRPSAVQSRLAPEKFEVGPQDQELGGPVLVTIARNGVVLRKERRSLPLGPLQFRVDRENERLSFQINEESPIVFFDVLPANRPVAGSYGLIWPGGVQINQLAAYQQPLPPESSPLEVADHLYAAGQYSQAYSEYRRQLMGLVKEKIDIQREADCKSALCLAALKRHEEAANLFGSLLGSQGASDRWSLIALSQSWRVRMEQNRFDEAADLSEILMLRFDKESLDQFISMDVRREILNAYAPIMSPVYGAMQLNGLRHLQSLEACQRLLEMSEAQQDALAIQMVAALRGSPQEEHASTTASSQVAALATRLTTVPRLESLQTYGYLLNQLGRTGAGISQTQVVLFGSANEQLDWELDLQAGLETKFVTPTQKYRPGLMPDGYLYLLEHARLLARVGKWKEARTYMEEALRFCELRRESQYARHAAQWLLAGAIEFELGNVTGARQKYRTATITSWLENSTASARRLSEHEVLLDYIAQSLGGTAKPDESRTTIDNVFATAGAAKLLELIDHHATLSDDACARLWSEPLGRRLATQIAIGNFTEAEQYRACVQLTVAEVIRIGCPLPDNSGAEQLEMVAGTVQALFGMARIGQLNHVQLERLLLAWRGEFGEQGWGGVTIPKRQHRAEVAYLLGLRMLRVFDRKQQAAELFRQVQQESLPKSDLHRFATSELQRLSQKSSKLAP